MSVALPPNSESQTSRSRAVDVERAVAQWIFRGELTAGEKLTEQEVALRLGVSRGPVREAFRALEDLGLVQIEQNRGASVRKIDLDEAVEIHDVYSALEELAARSAARRLSGTQIGELKSLVEAMDAAAESEDLDRYYSLNLSFHRLLVEGSGNRRLLSIYNRLLNELHLFRRFGLTQRGEMQLSNREHHQILDKIAAGDPEGAAEAMPFADGQFDAVACIYLFHELPPRIRRAVVDEIRRVLKPGGMLIFVDSLQTGDEPDYDAMLDHFPVAFHEPYFATYLREDLDRLWSPGFSSEARLPAYFSKVLSYRRDP